MSDEPTMKDIALIIRGLLKATDPNVSDVDLLKWAESVDKTDEEE